MNAPQDRSARLGRIGVFGAGAIGTFVGLALSSVGVPVTLVGRPWLVERASSLRAVGIGGRSYGPGPDLRIDSRAAALHGCDLVLLTVKSGATRIAATELASVLDPAVPIVSLQNGLHNPEILRAATRQPIAAGMVGFNVLWTAPTELKQATAAAMVVDRRPLAALGEPLQRACERAGLPLLLVDDIADVMAGKLLLNLNNGICAATGQTIAASLRSRPSRFCFAACIREGLGVLRRAGYHPRSIVGLPPAWIARLLGLPDAIVLRVAKRLVAIDPRAKSSTLQDLEAGKTTEIDDLNGEIVRLAARHGMSAPCNAFVTEVVHELERASDPKPYRDPLALGRALRARMGE